MFQSDTLTKFPTHMPTPLGHMDCRMKSRCDLRDKDGIPGISRCSKYLLFVCYGSRYPSVKAHVVPSLLVPQCQLSTRMDDEETPRSIWRHVDINDVTFRIPIYTTLAYILCRLLLRSPWRDAPLLAVPYRLWATWH